MNRILWQTLLALASLLAMAATARAQTRPYIGFVYPAGGQQGTTFQVKLGGQGMDDVTDVLVTGAGVSAKVVEFYRPIGPQEITLLQEQMRDLKRASATNAAKPAAEPAKDDPAKLIAKIEKRIGEYCNRPACAALAALVYLEVTIGPDAKPGERELRLVSTRGVSNPMAFHVGQVPEFSRKPLLTSPFIVLGKEELSLRKRSTNEIEDRITIPCTVNGQVAYGDVNRYRFDARKGQRLVLTTQARQLVPYIADAVPGWFQPVLLLQDAGGKEVAYDDDYRFKPDPTILFEAPKDGEYVLSIYDAIYRGREDFVYRVTIGELPFVTSIFPLGGRAGATAAIKMKGWNLDKAGLAPPPDAPPGLHLLVAGKAGFVSNRVPFALDTLPEVFEKESNNDPAHAQKVKLPVIVNGRIDRPDDWDVFQFTGHAGEMVVAEVYARRLDSPLDSVLKLTDAKGALLAFNDDREDPTAGVNTHHADSYLKATLPADGAYFVHLGDTARSGGEEYAYRLRLSAPRPDFALRVVPSSVSLRAKSTATVTVYAFRQDGFTNAIKLGLKDPPAGFSAVPASLIGTQEVARLTLKADLAETKQPVNLTIEGTAKIGDEEVSHVAVPAEDRMQAFLWRHLVPAQDFKALVFDPSYEPPPKRIPRARPAPTADVKAVVASVSEAANKPKFSKQQVAGRLRQLKLLFEEGLLMDDFYDEKVAECEASR